jgi:RNA polymerase sigma factor (sigma-70 family)
MRSLRRVAIGHPLGLYHTETMLTIRSDIVLIRPWFITDATFVVGFTALGAMLLDRNPRNGDEATDSVQTTFLQLMLHGEQINNPAGFASWLRTTLRHGCLRIVRHRSRVEVVASDEWWAQIRATDDSLIEDWVVRGEQLEIIRRLLAWLPDGQRELMCLLSHPDCGSYPWVSRQLGIPVGSIGPTRQRIVRRVRRGLAALQAERCA